MSKTIKMTLRIKPEHNPPDLGGWGPGVIATQEVVYEDDAAKEYGEGRLALSIINAGNDLMKNFMEVTFEEVESK